MIAHRPGKWIVAAVLGMAVMGMAVMGLPSQARAGEPFELASVEVTDGLLLAMWQDLQSTMQSEKRIVARCRAEPNSCDSDAARRFIAIVKEGGSYEGLARIGRINRAVNFAIRPNTAAAVQTAWASPLQALAAGVGDCKQYAVLKYAALAEAGVAPDDLRLVIARMKRQPSSEATPTDHAMIAVRNNARWYILDNRTLVMIESRKLLEIAQPLFSLDHRGVRQFILPPQVAALAPCDEAGG